MGQAMMSRAIEQFFVEARPFLYITPPSLAASLYKAAQLELALGFKQKC